MANVIYRKSGLKGILQIPPSKSAAHRAVLCAALSQGNCEIGNLELSDDLTATVNAVKALGGIVSYDKKRKTLLVQSADLGGETAEIDCLESGSTLRFMIPVAAALGVKTTFYGKGRLPQRPLGIYQKLLPEHGVLLQTEGGLPLKMEGKLHAVSYTLPGNVSSQFVTGLLLALPLLEGDSEIVLSSELESKGYVDLTISILADFGVSVIETATGWHIPGGQKYCARRYMVEGDWSQAAFFLCLAALGGGKIQIAGLLESSHQGDRACVSLFERFGLQLAFEDGVLKAWNPNAKQPFGGLKGFAIDVAQIPDMVPALTVCACAAEGETKIYHAERLRLKESDRLAAMAAAMNALGGRVTETEDGLMIKGVPYFSGGRAEGRNDHRIVMALAAAACRSSKEVCVTDAWSVRKSYPGFFEDLRKLGGIADVIDVG